MVSDCAAWTSPDTGAYPPYLNVTIRADRKVDIFARAPRQENGREGATIHLQMTSAEWARWLLDAIKAG